MTCFWNGILTGLKHLNNYSITGFNKKYNIKELILFLKKNNKESNNIFWDKKLLTKKELSEHKNAINNLDINKINNGYLCSTNDSFLFLICQLFEINIIHNYNNNIISYINKNKTKKTLYFKSNRGHFWFEKAFS